MLRLCELSLASKTAVCTLGPTVDASGAHTCSADMLAQQLIVSLGLKPTVRVAEGLYDADGTRLLLGRNSCPRFATPRFLPAHHCHATLLGRRGVTIDVDM